MYNITPELLAQMAAASFRPPAPMSMGGMAAPQGGGGTPGFNVGEAGNVLGTGLGMMFGKPGFDPANPGAAYGRTAGNADLGGYNGAPSMVDVGGGQMLPNPNAVGAADPSGFSGIMKFLGGLF